MPNMFDYLSWRGDLPFSAVPVSGPDALIFSTLAYLQFDGVVPFGAVGAVPLAQAALQLSRQENPPLRSSKDLQLLLAAAETPRFREVRLCFYREELLEEEQTQFAALVFLLPGGSAFLAFRGTDDTLVGWKEDFNMSFRTTVPAQHKAARYAGEFASCFAGPLYLGGHSKGGNLAVFAATQSADYQNRIQAVYNLDGPGFHPQLLQAQGYLSIVPKVRTYIPQSSIIGNLLEHEEPHTVIQSSQVGVLQHEPHSWEILGGDFLPAQTQGADARFVDRAVRRYLAQTTAEQREKFVDTVYELLSAGNAQRLGQLLHPKQLSGLLRSLNADEATRALLAAELERILQAARDAKSELPAAEETDAL